MITVAHRAPKGWQKEGGVRTYVRALLAHPVPGIAHHFDGESGTEGDIVHLHEQAALLGVDPADRRPMVYSLHNHSPYCPSGSKYLAEGRQPCDRQMSLGGCLWGMLADGCGSRRPERIVSSFRETFAELDRLRASGTLVLANSDFTRNQLLRHGLPVEQVVTLPLGLPRLAAPPVPLPSTGNRLLFAGRLSPEKGLDWLLRALARLPRSLALDVAGDGWERPRLEKLACELGLAGRVVWHGWCPQEKMRTLYDGAFAVVFPSLWHEPAGLVTLEAYRRARPVVASAVGGIPEFLRDGETGLLVPPDDTEALAATIDRLCRDPGLAAHLGEQGRAWFEAEFTLDLHVTRLATLYRRVLDGAAVVRR